MGLEIPDEVKWLSWIIGQDWPEGDETAMRRLATAWEDAATGVDELTSDLQTKAATVLSVVEGPAADSFREFWDTFVTTDPQYLPKLAEMCRALAQQCDDGANEIEYGKYMFIALLIVTAIQIAILIANMIETFGASAAGIPVVEGAAQVTSRTIAQQLLMAILKSVAWSELQSVGLDVLVQGIQIAQGHRDGLDLSKTGTAALDGLVNGVIGGAIGFGAGKIPGLSGAASPFKGMVQGAAREALSGAASGVAGAVAGAAIHGGDLSPDALAKAATSGGFGGAVGGAKGGMHEGAQAGAHSSGENAPSPHESDFSGSQSNSGSDGTHTGSDGSTSGSDGSTSGSEGTHTGSDGTSSGSDGGHTGPGDSGSSGTSDHTTSGDSSGGSSSPNEPHSGSDNGGSSGGSDPAPHTTSDGGGGSVTSDHPTYGDSGGVPNGSHTGSGGGDSASAAPHASSDGGNAVHTTSGDSGGAPHTDTGTGSSHDGASFNRAGLLSTPGGSTPSSATSLAPSGTTTAGYDGGGSSTGHASSAGRMDALLNSGSPGGGTDHASPASPHATTLANAGSDASAAAPVIGGTPGGTGRGNSEGAPSGTTPTQAAPSAGGMPMAPPVGGGGTSGSSGGGDRGFPRGGTTSEPRGYQPSTTRERPGGTTDRSVAGTGPGTGTERPGSPGTDRRPGSSSGRRTEADATPSAPWHEERPSPASTDVPTSETHETPTDRTPGGEPHEAPSEGEHRPVGESEPTGRQGSPPPDSAPVRDEPGAPHETGTEHAPAETEPRSDAGTPTDRTPETPGAEPRETPTAERPPAEQPRPDPPAGESDPVRDGTETTPHGGAPGTERAPAQTRPENPESTAPGSPADRTSGTPAGEPREPTVLAADHPETRAQDRRPTDAQAGDHNGSRTRDAAPGEQGTETPMRRDESGHDGSATKDDGADPSHDGSDDPHAPDNRTPEEQLRAAEEEARQILDQLGPDAPTVDFTSNPIDPAAARAINDSLRSLVADYPDTVRQLKHIGSNDPANAFAPGDPTLAYALTSGDERGVYVNPDDFGNAEELARSGAEEENDGWTVPGGGGPEGIFNHEFGHQLGEQLLRNPRALADLNQAVSEVLGTPYDATGPHDTATKAALKAHLSDYGKTNPHEAMAEAFAEYRGSENPRPLAKAIGEVMDRYLRAPETMPHEGTSEPATGHDGASEPRLDGSDRPAGPTDRVPEPLTDDGRAGTGPKADERPGTSNDGSEHGTSDESDPHRRQSSGTDDRTPIAGDRSGSAPEHHNVSHDEPLARGDDGRLHREGDAPGTYRDEDGTLHHDRDAPGTYRDEDGTLHRHGDSEGTYRSEDGKLHFDGDPPKSFRNDLTHRLHGEDGQFVKDPFRERDIDHHAEEGERSTHHPSDQVADHLRDLAQERTALAQQAADLRKEMQPHQQEFGIKKPSDLSKAKLKSKINELTKNVERDNGLTREEKAAKLLRLKELESLAAKHNARMQDLVRLSERMGMAGAEDYAVNGRGGTLLTPLEDKPGTPGTLDAVGFADGNPPRLIVAEAKGGSSELGSRLVEGGKKAEQGSPEYLRWVLERDPDLRAALDANPAVRERIQNAFENGTLQYEYHRVHVDTTGKVVHSQFNLDRGGEPFKSPVSGVPSRPGHDGATSVPADPVTGGPHEEHQTGHDDGSAEPRLRQRRAGGPSAEEPPRPPEDGRHEPPDHGQTRDGSGQTNDHTAPRSEPRQSSESVSSDGPVPGDNGGERKQTTDPLSHADSSAAPRTAEPHDTAGARTTESDTGASRTDEPQPTGDRHDGTSVPPDEHGTTSHTDGVSPSTDNSGTGASHSVGPSGAPVGLHEHAIPGDFHHYGDGIGTNDQRAVPLLEGYKPWGDLPDKAAFDAAHRPDGRVNWPPNDGAAGPARRITLPAGTVLDRFGYPGGEYLSPLRPDGRPYSYGERAILPDNLAKGYHTYVLDAPVTVDMADVAPAFEQDGGGRQVKLVDTDLAALLDDGLIHEVPVPPSDGLVLPHDYGTARPDGTAPEPTTVGEARQPHPGAGTAEHPAEPGTTGHGPPSPAEPHLGHTSDQPHHDGVPHDGSHDGAHDGAHVPTDVPEHLPQHLHDVYAASEETPAGRSLYTPDQHNMRDLAQRVHADPNHYVLDGHGNADGIRFGDRTLSARDVAEIIRSDPGWNGRDVLLISCETGAYPGAFAAQLSRELGVPVTAPDHLAWTDNQGRIYSSSSEPGTDGRSRPTWPPDGGWYTYQPDGSSAGSGHDGFPPHHAGEDAPHGQDHAGPPDHAHHAASRGDDTTPEHEPGGHSEPPGAHPDEEAPVHAIHPNSPYAEPFHPRMDTPVVHVPADDPRVVPDEPFSHRTDLNPNTRYTVEGRGTFWTDENCRVRYVDAEIPNTRHGQNPDVHHPLPEVQYRIRTEHGELTFTTDENGHPPFAALFEPPTHFAGDPSGPPIEVPTVTVGAHPGADASIPAPRPGEGFAHRTDLDPNTRYDVYDIHGNHVGTYTTDGTGAPRWIETESGRQYRQHPEFGKNLEAGVQYRTSENFDLNIPKGPDANFNPPPHTDESRITLDSKEGDSLHRRVSSNDPFVGRDGLEPNHKYVIEQKWGKRVEPYAVCYTDGEGKVVAVDTFRPFNPDLNNSNSESQIRVNHLDQHGAGRPTLLNTRHAVEVSHPEGQRGYVGTHSLTHDPDSTRGDNKYRRDGSAQSEVGSVGRAEHPGTRYAGGHGARNAEGMMGEAAGQMPQLHAQNSGLNSDGVTRGESWYQMEEDRMVRAEAGAAIGPINALGAFLPSEGTPQVMWQVWTESHDGQPPRLFIRSFLNVPVAADSSLS